MKIKKRKNRTWKIIGQQHIILPERLLQQVPATSAEQTAGVRFHLFLKMDLYFHWGQKWALWSQ